MLKHDSDHETISYFPRSIVAQMLNEAREQVLTSMKRGKKVWICLDCGMMATGTIPMYHNKDHTFKFKGILIEFPEGKGGSSE